jgi:tRNA C32,U32 (ribose-2'-O)-methylase TrmJ
MLNFGLHELRVVDPVCDILSKDALALGKFIFIIYILIT